MPISYVNFRFRFYDNNGKTSSFFPLQGRVDKEGISFEDETLWFVDISRVHLYHHKLVILLKPFIAIGKRVSDNILKETNCIALDIAEPQDVAFDVKASIDQRLSKMYVQRIEKELKKDGLQRFFRQSHCPVCDSHIDLSLRKDTPLVYCPYCLNVFDKHGNILPDTEDYNICPECGYYNRLRERTEFHFYALRSERKAHIKKRYCCDTCSERDISENLWKDALYLAALPNLLYQGFRNRRGGNPIYEQLTLANRYAQDGNFEKAHQIYTVLMLRNDGHPGIHLNYGLAYLKAGDEENAAREFQKSLAACSNYQPTLEVLQEYSSLEIEV